MAESSEKVVVTKKAIKRKEKDEGKQGDFFSNDEAVVKSREVSFQR